MDIRLAHEQGILHQPDLNHFQHFALLYWIYLDRRTLNEKTSADLEIQCFNLFPERWKSIYWNTAESVLAPPSHEDGIPVTDIDELDAWYSSLQEARQMSGADLPGATERWGDWQ